MHEPS
ncbi:ferric transport system permease protein FbpB, partial [Vibrio cholerae HC-52A1]